MFNHQTDNDWEEFGKSDPYFSVLTHEKFRKSKLTDKAKDDFFESGEEDLSHILKIISKFFAPDYSVKKALDFGCGVGRLSIPLSKSARTVTGIDVSESMLQEAKKNCESRGIKNTYFVKSDDKLSALEGTFDFILSLIVFQHIPPQRGELIFENLLAKLEDGGIGVIHFTYAKDYKISKLHYFYKIFFRLMGVAKMQMNIYNLNKIFFLMQKAGISRFYVEFKDCGGESGVVVYFQKLKDMDSVPKAL